jgi:hypothetical protein
MARANVAAHGLGDGFRGIQADWTQCSLEGTHAAFMDPSRRADGKRIHSIFQYRPSRSCLPELMSKVPHVGVKISPGVRSTELDRLGAKHKVELASQRGAVKEAILWFGDLRTGLRRATLLPSEETIEGAPNHAEVPAPASGRFIYEPDGAVIRAGLLEALATPMDLHKIHPDIAYISGDKQLSSPLGRGFEIEETHTPNLGRLRKRLRELRVGEVIVKKRRVDVDPDAARLKFAPRGPNLRVIILTRTPKQRLALICHEVRDALAG